MILYCVYKYFIPNEKYVLWRLNKLAHKLRCVVYYIPTYVYVRTCVGLTPGGITTVYNPLLIPADYMYT